MSKIQALLVGINTYHPDSRVTPLNGCVPDLQSMELFLKENFSSQELSIKTLINEEATREAIVGAFQDTLITNVNEGDFAFFSYSGHGSFRPTAEEFKAFDPKEQDETLVCYDSRLPGNSDLSDKELALLLHKIPKGVNIILVIDSCHSGSISRNIKKESSLIKARFISQQNDVPTLESYAVNGDNYYSQMFKKEGKLVIPRTPHIVLAACDRGELAWETDDGRGLFSSTLLNVLNKNPRVSYANLFAQIRGKVRQTTRIQMPGIYAYEQFNQNQIFLTTVTDQNKNRHIVRKIDGKWRMEYGAIHSLPTDPKEYEKIQVALYPDITMEDQDQVITFCKIVEVKLKESILDYESFNFTAQYQAEIVSIPPNLSILLEGSDEAKSKFRELYDQLTSPFILLSDELDYAKYKLIVTNEQLAIYWTENNRLIHGIKRLNKYSVNYITSIMEKIEEWERLKHLENKNTNANIKDIELVFFEEKESGELVPTDSNDISFEYPKVKDKEDIRPIWYQIKARNTSNFDWYVAVLHLTAGFGIATNFDCQMIPKASKWITLDDQRGVYISDPKALESTDIFKVIISTDPFDDYKFASQKFDIGVIKEPARNVITKAAYQRKKAEEDWYTQTITVKLTREKN